MTHGQAAKRLVGDRLLGALLVRDVSEVKAGEIPRDARGRRYAGDRKPLLSRFELYEPSMHARGKLAGVHNAPPTFHPIAGCAVALPDGDLAGATAILRLIGPEPQPDLIWNRTMLQKNDSEVRCRVIEPALELRVGNSADRPAPCGYSHEVTIAQP